MKIGPTSETQMKRLGAEWRQGEHIVVSGGTGSGKTLLARQLDQIRLDKGGHVIVFVAKLQPDKTILSDYKGFTRWKKYKKSPSPSDNRILLWPDTSKAKTLREAREMQREVFGEAFNEIGRVGTWTLHIDEGLYMCSPMYMNMSDEVAMLHALGRSANLTIITLTQRPSHLPLIVYGSASHAFAGRTRENSDMKRLAEMGGRESAKEMQARISGQGRHDFLWLPIAPDWPPETVNLSR